MTHSLHTAGRSTGLSRLLQWGIVLFFGGTIFLGTFMVYLPLALTDLSSVLQWGIFLFFGGMIFLGTTMVYFLYPETKGLAMEDAPNVFKDHWYWKRYAQRPNRLREAVCFLQNQHNPK